MRKTLLILLGLAGILRAEDGPFTNIALPSSAAAPTPEMTWTNVHEGGREGIESYGIEARSLKDEMFWTNVPIDCWGDKARPYAIEGLKAWYRETNPQKKAEIAQRVLELATKCNATDLGMELLLGRPVAQAEISIPTNATPLPLSSLKEWDLPGSSDAVIRRVGTEHFEMWTSKNGWLFSTKGEILVQANPHRREVAWGKDWHGAFLKNGQWLTTDLWTDDDRLYLFSPEGRLLRAFPTHAGWARADKGGEHWVVGNAYSSIGEHSDLKISPWGWRQKIGCALKRLRLPLPDASWNFVGRVKDARAYVNPRELGSRGVYLILNAESEDRKSSIECHKAGHGNWIEFPTFTVSGPNLSWRHGIPNGWETYNFGFFPASSYVWIGRDKYPERSEQKFCSWIINPDGKVLGWLPAERVGDDPDGKRMWFVDEQGRILKVGPDGAVSEVLQPTLSGATGNEAPFAHVLFPDLKLGFFYTKPGHLVLAKWN